MWSKKQHWWENPRTQKLWLSNNSEEHLTQLETKILSTRILSHFEAYSVSLPSPLGIGGGFIWFCDVPLRQWRRRKRNWEGKIQELTVKKLLWKVWSAVQNLKRVEEKKDAKDTLWSSQEWTIKNPRQITYEGLHRTQATLGLQLEKQQMTTNREFEKITRGEAHQCQL